MIAEFFIYLIPFKEISNYNINKKNTPKGALCKYSNSVEERFECSGCHPIKHRFACFLEATVHSISLCD